MIVYELIHPDGPTLDIADRVIQGQNRASNIIELAFEIDRTTTPSAADVRCNNFDGFFEQFQGFFQGEITEYIVNIKEDNISTFLAFISDIEYKDPIAILKLRSITADVLTMAIPEGLVDFVKTGTPAEIVQEILTNQAKIPSLFFDALQFESVAQEERNRGIEIAVNIPANDKVNLSEIIQEIYKMTGLYVYSQRGLLKAERAGNFNTDGFEYLFGIDDIIAGSVKRRRPVLAQKTRAVVPTTTGPVAKNMSFHFPTQGPTLIERFREKTIEADGLDGKILHTSTASAEEATNDILGFRGFVRYEFTFEVNISSVLKRAGVQAVPLFSVLKIEHLGGTVSGVVVEKKILKEKAQFKMLSITDPISNNPALLRFPEMVNSCGQVIIWSIHSFKLEYHLGDDAPAIAEINQVEPYLILDNRSQRALFIRVIEYRGRVVPAPNWFRLDHKVELPFILGCNFISQIIGAA